MGFEGQADWRFELASALEWWRDAGVDVLVEDEVRDWTAKPEAHLNTPQPAVPIRKEALEPPPLPATIEAFLDWRYAMGAPESSLGEELVLPEGEISAPLMVVTDIPEFDGDTPQLMSGPAGRLLDHMLAAIGKNRESIYLVSLCAARTITGQVPRRMESRLAELLRHQISLIAPKQLLLLGQSASRAVLGPDSGRSADGLVAFNYSGGQSLAVASFHPRLFLSKPAAKAEAWKDLQMLIKGQQS